MEILQGKQQNKFEGNYIGRVESVSDPDKLMRVRVRVYGVFTDQVPTSDLPWAEYAFPVGARANNGIFIPVAVGDYLWVDFPHGGDTRRPRIKGSVHYAPDGIPNLPAEAFAGTESLTHKTTGGEPTPATAEYHENVVFTQHGVTVEINSDTSFTLTQRATGTAIRISAAGDITLHGEKDVYMSSSSALKMVVGGAANIAVAGACSLSASSVGITAPVSITGDLTVNGTVTASGDISSSGNITASGNMIDGGTNTNHHSH